MEDYIGLIGLAILFSMFFLIWRNSKKKIDIYGNYNQNKSSNLEHLNKDKNNKSPFYKKLLIVTIVAPIIVNIPSLSSGLGISRLTFPILLGGIIWTLISYFSLKTSKATSDKLKSHMSSSIDKELDASKTLKDVVHDKIQDNKEKKEKQVLKEDEIYDQIGKEIEQDKKVRSVWTKALSQADGDVNKAESQYIKLRFEQLNK